MHNYSTNSSKRKSIVATLAIMSVLINIYLGNIFDSFWGIEISIPSSMALFGIFYLIFDQIAWKFPLLHRLGLVVTPNLNGIWSGEIRSSYDNYETPYQINLTISQSWTQISIVLSTEKSKSESFMVGMLVDNPSNIRIIYTYRNDPKSDAEETMQMHIGTTFLSLSNNDKLEGEYYSGRGRLNTGTISLTKVSNQPD